MLNVANFCTLSHIHQSESDKIMKIDKNVKPMNSYLTHCQTNAKNARSRGELMFFFPQAERRSYRIDIFAITLMSSYYNYIQVLLKFHYIRGKGTKGTRAN